MRRFLTFIIIGFCWLNSFSSDKNVLVIHSYHQGLEWTDSISSGIMSVFRNHPEVNLYFEYADSKRNTSKSFYDNYLTLYQSRSSKIKYDAIIVADNFAYEFMKKERDHFYPGVPVFYCGVNFLDKNDLKEHSGFYGFEEIANHSGTIDIIRHIYPKRKKLLIVNDNTLTGHKIRQELEQVLPKYKSDLEFEIADTFNITELKERISHLTDNYCIYLLVMNMDRDGNYISYNQGIKLVSENTLIPIFGSWDFYLGKGIMGGEITSGSQQGSSIAKLTYAYINKQDTLPPTYQKGYTSPIFDKIQLNKFGISESTLPKNASIINVSHLEPEQILHLKIAIIALSIIFAIFLFLYFERKKQSKKLKKLVELRTKELKSANTDLEKTNRSKNEILSVVAHDLRNPIGNIGGFIQIVLENNDNLKFLDKENKTLLNHIADLSNHMIKLVNNLLDASIESGNMNISYKKLNYINFLFDTVEKNKALAKNQNAEIKIAVSSDNIPVCIDENKIQQVINNLISNALKFSDKNRNVEVSVSANNKIITTIVRDFGIGIESDKIESIFEKFSQLNTNESMKSRGTGLGLSIVKGIIEAHNGKIYARSIVGEGSEFIFEIPIAHEHETIDQVSI